MQVVLDEFGDEDFIQANSAHFDKYIDKRVQGYSSYDSFMTVFGASHWQGVQQGHNRIAAIESSDYFKTNFNQRLEESKPHDLWSPKIAIHELLSLVRNSTVRDSTRLNAAKELNIMVGIVIVDENGKTKAGRSLKDFYDDNEVTN